MFLLQRRHQALGEHMQACLPGEPFLALDADALPLCHIL